MSPKNLEKLVQVLSVLTFVVMCWAIHRALDERTQCVSSPFLSYVQIGDTRVANCAFESRLSLNLSSLTFAEQVLLRKLEVLDPLAEVIKKRLGLVVEISLTEPKLFELGDGFLRLGKAWFEDKTQLHRALIMGVLRTQFPQTYANQFQLEVVTDFILLAVFDIDRWVDSEGETYSLGRDMSFAAAAPSFTRYCESPFRSLAHASFCEVEGPPEDAGVWALRPLLAASLWRVYEKLELSQKLNWLASLSTGVSLPVVASISSAGASPLVAWFKQTLESHLLAFTGKVEKLTVQRALKELEVEAPTRWELTMDVTHTPAWREILEQMRQRATFAKERVLVFTPEGARALPSNLPVAWPASEVRSQKHVLIACAWPKPKDAVPISARHTFAQQSCGKLAGAFWEE